MELMMSTSPLSAGCVLWLVHDCINRYFEGTFLYERVRHAPGDRLAIARRRYTCLHLYTYMSLSLSLSIYIYTYLLPTQVLYTFHIVKIRTVLNDCLSTVTFLEKLSV